MDQINVAIIGLGMRGTALLDLILDTMPDVRICGISDLYEDRMLRARQIIVDKRGYAPEMASDYRRLLLLPELDAVITPSSWEAHIDICIDAMQAGKYAASEVGGAYSIDQCFELVRTYEKTGVPVMLLENCCYGLEEMTVLNMVKQGLFGELVHCEGGYQHDLREEVATGKEMRHYRLHNYMHRNAEVYPTHELGPISKYLNINRGNRMLTLTSMASRSGGVNEWIRTRRGSEHENASYPFAMGDIVTTSIKCAHGETILLTHDTTLPRPYSRGGRVQGTRGIWLEDKHGVLLDNALAGDGEGHEFRDLEAYYDDYMHPLWREYRDHVVGGHDGIDYLVMRAFVEAVKARTAVPIDAYDMASWMAVSVLSEQSVAMGSMPVPVPDFTNGRWLNREPFVRSKYCLEEVCGECF